jgi:hypothetical protein
MERSRHFPNFDRLSVLTATILIAYVMAIFIDLPGIQTSIVIFNRSIDIQIQTQTLVAYLVAGLTAAGMNWLLRDHPTIGDGRSIQHLILPALTAWVISLPLYQLPVGTAWWIGFLLGGTLIVLVLIAEYIVVDPNDIRQPPAAVGLTVISFALYLVLAAALRFSGSRLIVILFALGVAVSLVSLRTLNLRLHGYWAFIESGVTAIVIAQIAAALYFWPLSPVSFGLLLLGPAYALTNLMGNLAEGETVRQALVEPIAVLLLVWMTAYWIR